MASPYVCRDVSFYLQQVRSYDLHAVVNAMFDSMILTVAVIAIDLTNRLAKPKFCCLPTHSESGRTGL